MGVTAILVAGGHSARMKGTDKMTLKLDGVTVLERSLRAFALHPEVDAVVAVTRPDLIPLVEGWRTRYPKITAVVAGGETRCLSVKAGIAAVPETAEFVAIHDGARPFVSAELITEVIRAAEETGAAAPATAVVDTVKTVDGLGFVTGTPDRSILRAVSTPQVFRFETYRRLIQNETDSFDDCQLFEKAGLPVKLVPGDRTNFKITSPEDVARAKMQTGDIGFRVGHGYDVHRLTEGRKLILGGVEIPYEKGLLGHSDADVLLHAVSDAILGAAALGDIGKHFPDTDDWWEGADSRIILRECVRLAAEAGFRPVNVDVTVLCQRPKLAPHIPAMRANLAQDLELPVDRISVKATTEEGLGFTGEGLGIACHAVTLMKGA